MNTPEKMLLEPMNWVDYCDALSNELRWPAAPVQGNGGNSRSPETLPDAAVYAARNVRQSRELA